MGDPSVRPRLHREPGVLGGVPDDAPEHVRSLLVLLDGELRERHVEQGVEVHVRRPDVHRVQQNRVRVVVGRVDTGLLVRAHLERETRALVAEAATL